MEISFIKLRVDMFDDNKVKIILGLKDGIFTIYFFTRLLALAGKQNMGGYIVLSPDIPMGVEELSSITGHTIGEINYALNTLFRYGLISKDEEHRIYITNWEKHQNTTTLDKIRDQSRERSKRYRETQKMKMIPATLENNLQITSRVTSQITSRYAPRNKNKREENKNKDTVEKNVTVSDNFQNLLEEYNPSTFTDEQKKERMSLMYKEMKNSIRITEHAKTYDRTETTIKEHLSNFIRERFLTDDAHHSITQYWHYFSLYLKKQNL